METDVRPWATPLIRSAGLSPRASEKHHFEAHGFCGPIPLLSPEQCRAQLRSLRAAETTHRPDWSKGFAAVSRDFHALATRPEILDRVAAFLGDDLILWGASLTTVPARSVHPWHCDIETVEASGRSVSVWIGLENTSREASIRFASGSHRFRRPVQQVIAEERIDASRDDEIEAAAQRIDPNSRILSPPATDGEALFFDNRAWHTSINRRPDVPRSAVLLQYATPDALVRPLLAPGWPFQYRADVEPPCVVVRGSGAGSPNRIVPPPPNRDDAFPRLHSRVGELSLPLSQEAEKEWTPHGLFQGSTPNVLELSCHVSVLRPGCSPHAPHSHLEEELLLVIDGEAELVLVEEDCREVLQPVTRGCLAFYPRHRRHTLRCTGDAPVTYLMLRWTGPPREAFELQKTGVFGWTEADGSDTTGGFRAFGVFEGSTVTLGKLHVHASLVSPGAGYATHVDGHDVVILMHEGEVETGGRRIGPHGFAFFPGGTRHGLRNVGDVTARYWTIEFHR